MRFKFFVSFLIVLFTLPAAIPSFSQFKDFRKATVIKSNGDSIAGEVSYKINFYKRKKILVKESLSKQEIPVSELDKIILSTGEVYAVIVLEDSTRKKVLARAFVDGGVSLYKAGDIYYLKKDTSIFKLDNKTIKVKRDGKEYRTPSKKYLSALHIAFMDCQTLNYEPLANRISLKLLTNLIYQYGMCKNIPIKNVARPTIELAFSAGTSALKLNSSFIEGSAYNSGNGSSYNLSFLRDFGSTNRFKVRLDLNYLKSDISGSFTTRHTDVLGTRKEYVTFSTAYKGMRIPIGLQYYFFNNLSSLYISGGLLFAINNYEDFDAEGYFIFDENGMKIYEPSFRDHFKVKAGPISGLWCAIGGDIGLNNRLKLNIELKAIKTVFDVFGTATGVYGQERKMESVSINEFYPSLGLKYRIR